MSTRHRATRTRKISPVEVKPAPQLVIKPGMPLIDDTGTVVGEVTGIVNTLRGDAVQLRLNQSNRTFIILKNG